MSRSGKTRLSLAVGKLCILSLGLAVFSWGTGYKLSLYFLPGQSNPIVPVAKLLCPEEGPHLSAHARSTDVKAKPSKPPRTFTLIAATRPSALVQTIQRVDEQRRFASPARSASFIHFASLPHPLFPPPSPRSNPFSVIRVGAPTHSACRRRPLRLPRTLTLHPQRRERWEPPA